MGGYSAPYSWGIHPDINMDIPEQFRSFVNYRTTLGHKINHKFAPSTNSQFEVVKHVLFGPIVSIVATKVIEAGEEVFVDYNYDVDSLNNSHWQWFSDAYKQHQRSRTMELTDNLINIEL